MNVLVTGGAGYLGTELVTALSTKREVNSITVYDNLSRDNYNLFLWLGNRGEKVRFIKGDVLDSRQLRKALAGIDVVYHLAAKVTTPYANADSHFFEQVNHWGTAELVQAVEGSGIKQFVFASSTAVYGNSAQPVDETSPVNPISYYGHSKLRAEEQVKRLFKKTPTLIFRSGNVYGYSPSMRFDTVINKFLFEAHFSGRISIQGSGEQIRPFIHIKSVAAKLASALNSPIESGIYNLAERNLSILEAANALSEIYPGLEHLFISPHTVHPSLNVQMLENTIPPDFLSQLLDFKNRFAFGRD